MGELAAEQRVGPQACRGVDEFDIGEEAMTSLMGDDVKRVVFADQENTGPGVRGIVGQRPHVHITLEAALRSEMPSEIDDRPVAEKLADSQSFVTNVQMEGKGSFTADVQAERIEHDQGVVSVFMVAVELLCGSEHIKIAVCLENLCESAFDAIGDAFGKVDCGRLILEAAGHDANDSIGDEHRAVMEVDRPVTVQNKLKRLAEADGLPGVNRHGVPGNEKAVGCGVGADRRINPARVKVAE